MKENPMPGVYNVLRALCYFGGRKVQGEGNPEILLTTAQLELIISIRFDIFIIPRE
jgi:hypothetical protein